MVSREEKRQSLQPLTQQSLYDTTVFCGRYLTNRALSVSYKATKSAFAAASSLGSLASRRQSTEPNMKTKGAQAATAYLQGIRGYAAVVVYIFHATWAHSGIVEHGYGVDQNNLRPIQLPIVRLIYSGHAMVALFFIIGGYVNASKPLQLIHNQRYAELTTQVGSSLLRRAFRLYLPVLAATLITALITYIGFLEPARRNLDTIRGVFYWPDYHPVRHTSLWATLVDWRRQMVLLLDLWHQPFYTHYDPHLWTVPLELRASLVLSVSLAAVACCRIGPRMSIMGLLTLYSVISDRWEVAMFLSGAILAELDTMSKKATSERGAITLGVDDKDEYTMHASMVGSRAPRPRGQMVGSLGIFILALAGLHLLSYPPKRGDTTPGFANICKWLVPYWASEGMRYVHGPGAVLFLAAVSRSKTLQRPFNTPTAQYLGTISYALYIVHGPVLHTVGYLVSPAMLAFTGAETTKSQTVALLLAGMVNFLVVLSVADIFHRFVNIGSARIAVRFQQLCSISGH